MKRLNWHIRRGKVTFAPIYEREAKPATDECEVAFVLTNNNRAIYTKYLAVGMITPQNPDQKACIIISWQPHDGPVGVCIYDGDKFRDTTSPGYVHLKYFVDRDIWKPHIDNALGKWFEESGA